MESANLACFTGGSVFMHSRTVSENDRLAFLLHARQLSMGHGRAKPGRLKLESFWEQVGGPSTPSSSSFKRLGYKRTGFSGERVVTLSQVRNTTVGRIDAQERLSGRLINNAEAFDVVWADPRRCRSERVGRLWWQGGKYRAGRTPFLCGFGCNSAVAEPRNVKIVEAAAAGSKDFRASLGDVTARKSRSDATPKDSNLAEAVLPLRLTGAITVESLGFLYKGAGEDKYWSDSRSLHRHPYPVGYTALKAYKGLLFRQSIEEGQDGPVFLVGEVGKEPAVADSPAKAWALALEQSRLDGSVRIHGKKHYGFDSPVVLRHLLQMEENAVQVLQDFENFPKYNKKAVQKLCEDSPDGIRGEENVTQSLQEYTQTPKQNSGGQKESMLAVAVKKSSGGIARNNIRLRSSLLEDSTTEKVKIDIFLGEDNEFLRPPSRASHNRVDSSSNLNHKFEEKAQDIFAQALGPHKASFKETKIGSRTGATSSVETVQDSLLVTKKWRKDGVVSTETSNGEPSGSSSWRRELIQRATGELSSQKRFGPRAAPVNQIFSGGPLNRNNVSRFWKSPLANEAKGGTSHGPRSLANLLQDWSKSERWESIFNQKSLSDSSNKSTEAAPIDGHENDGAMNTERDDRSLVSSENQAYQERRSTLGAQFLRQKSERRANRHPIGDTSDAPSGFRLSDGTSDSGGNFVWNGEKFGSGSGGKMLLAEEIRQLIVDQKFEEALTVLKQTKETGQIPDQSVFTGVFPFTVHGWQSKAVEHVNNGNSVLVCAPTGAGKSTVVELCLYETLAKEKKALVVTPFEGLVQHLFQKFQKMYGISRVGAFWGGHRIHEDAPLIVVTVEALLSVVRQRLFNLGTEKGHLLGFVDLVVLDKFQTLGDEAIGPMWEELLLLVGQQAGKSNIKLLALSMPAKNAGNVVSWLDSIYGPCKLVTCKLESVPKTYLFCDPSGLHPLHKIDGAKHRSAYQTNGNKGIEELRIQSSGGSLLTSAHFRPSLRYLLCGLEKQMMLPAVVFFFRPENCNVGLKDATEIYPAGLLSEMEVTRVRVQLDNLLETNPNLRTLVKEEDEAAVLLGMTAYHEGQLPVWQNFLRNLLQNDLIKLVFATESLLQHTHICVRTVVISSVVRNTHAGNSLLPTSEFWQLQGVAGQRGVDAEGTVVFLKSLQSGPKEAASVVSESPPAISSAFTPSYSLILNLVSKHSLPQVKEILQRSFSDHVVSDKLVKVTNDASQLDQKIKQCQKQKQLLEDKLFQELARENGSKLKEAAIFTRVDVRAQGCGKPWSHGVIPAVLLAVVPGPTEMFYMTLCADNNFRLVPAGAIDHVYLEEATVDTTFKKITGDVLQSPSIPPKEKWNVMPTGSSSYVAVGSKDTSILVDVILQHSEHQPCPDIEDKAKILRKDIEAVDLEMKSLHSKVPLHHGNGGTGEVETRATESATWKEAIRKIQALERAGALTPCESNTSLLKLQPLGVLISRLQGVENELWVALLLTSSVIKPLTAPELAAIFSALALNEQQKKKFVPNKVEPLFKAPKRIQLALGKLATLREEALALQGFDNPPLCFDTSVAASVHAWARGTYWSQLSRYTSLSEGGIVRVLQKTIKLLQLIDSVSSQSTKELSALGGTPGLHNIARRAALLLQRFPVESEEKEEEVTDLVKGSYN